MLTSFLKYNHCKFTALLEYFTGIIFYEFVILDFF